jgi:hypothetical protein
LPKIKYLSSAQEKQQLLIEHKTAKLCQDFRGAVFEIRGRYNLKQNEVAEMTGFNTGTFSLRLKNPDNFTFGELVKLITVFPELRESFIKSLENL